ncbi:MAG: ABC transporter permease [Jiangellaceae bacterium]
MTTAVTTTRPEAGAGPSGSTLAGTGALIRFILRRERIRIPLWLLGIVALVAVQAAAVVEQYPTQADLDAVAETAGSDPAFLAMVGPDYALNTVGGNTVWQISAFGTIIVALMSMSLVGRNTRAEEESGRAELVRATVVGRHAQLTAALVVVAAVNLVMGTLVALSLLGQDLPVAGSVAFGAALAGGGLVFTAVTAVGAQVTESTRAAYGITAAVMGGSFALRAAGDVGNGVLSWLSPIGWVQQVRSFADERWWVLLLLVATAAVLVAVAYALVSRRDLAAGLVRPRPGPAAASAAMGGPLGFAFRLHRGTLIGWTAGMFVGGLVLGSVGNDVQDIMGGNEEINDIFTQAGGASIAESYLGSVLLMMAIVGAGYAVSAALRLSSEEAAGRAEPLLATALSRWRWVGSHAVVALVGSVVVLAALGLGAGAAYAATTGDDGAVLRLLGAALTHAPAVWVVAGATVALFGLVPRFAAAAWAVLGLGFVVLMFGPLLDLPDWLRALSPFDHSPQVPAVDLTVGPLGWLLAVAALLLALGLTAFRRRDVITT